MSLFGKPRRAATAGLPVEGSLPGFDGATGWLNSPPLTEADLDGKVVLTSTSGRTRASTGCARSAYVRAWAEKYAEQGLVVVGVHTPEFPFEQDPDNVRAAART